MGVLGPSTGTYMGTRAGSGYRAAPSVPGWGCGQWCWGAAVSARGLGSAGRRTHLVLRSLVFSVLSR